MQKESTGFSVLCWVTLLAGILALWSGVVVTAFHPARQSTCSKRAASSYEAPTRMQFSKYGQSEDATSLQ